MDALIEKLDGSRYLLSQYDVQTTQFEDEPIEGARNSTQLDARNGSIDFGGWHKSKTVDVSGYIHAENMLAADYDTERLKALFATPEGFYITRRMPVSQPGFERPGEHVGGAFDHDEDVPDHKRFLVYCNSLDLEFVGSNGEKQVYKMTAELKTLALPYGESIPEDIAVKSRVPYAGTVPCSQLEQQFMVEFTASATADKLSLTIGATTLEFTGKVAAGDVFRFTGFSYTQNSLNVVNATNKVYFILVPGDENKVSTSVSGKVRILHRQDLFA